MEIFASLILVLLQNVVFGEVSNYDYSMFGPDHTMIKYTAKACPADLMGRGLNVTDAEALLHYHNIFRANVAKGAVFRQPTAANMQELKWDAELADIAQRWADQCVSGRDMIRLTNSSSLHVGQNVGKTVSNISGGETDIIDILNQWADEVIDPGFNPTNINPFKYDDNVARYTQMAWAETNRIGCGFAYFYADELYHKLYVCNYAPGGNLEGGDSIYHIGTTASECASGPSPVYLDLCES